MAPPPDDPWLLAMMNGVLLASAGTWIYLGAKWSRAGAALEYSPRRPVPWGAGATVLALLLAAMTIASGQPLDPAQPQQAATDPIQTVQQIVGSIMLIVLLSGTFVLLVALMSRALPSDLGLPASLGELARDMWIGVLAFLAAVAPVFGSLGLLQYFLGLENVSHHPLIETVSTSQNWGVFALATVAAVVVAPVFEELTFRLLLQGWLEKWQDRRRRFSGASDHGITGGWIPILLSSVVFAAAHYGYGPEPVPIFVLAIILGYVYHRTHRIIPCMVAHGMFNLLNMAALWRMVLHPAA